ncbi:MAG: electron transfer flavoprotein subunit beta/FixA family protein [Chloroflexi bacterium]|nr:electron transfer flavoprotein subunit beta/FixA family protein [Chloroflexota bacterium]MBU1748598.1 electron transfer flavoprotein subunit beta/FixA family protein [Chloroflexota bacterium]
MRIVVCIKQVPDTNEVKLDPRTGTLIREGVPSIINPEDKNAIEEALKLREAGLETEIIVITMGPPQADAALREALAMGADRAILLSDRAFAGSDTWATANALGLAVEHLGDYGLVLCGRQAIDGDTAQVGPQLAEYLDIPQVTYVRELEIVDGKVRAKRTLEDGYEEIDAPLPALLTITDQANTPRYPRAAGIFSAYREQTVEIWGAKEVNADEEKLGLKGSPTQVKRSFAPEPKGTGEMLSGTDKEMTRSLVQRLRGKNLI